MRLVIVSNTSTYMVRFRSELMAEMVRRGCDVTVLSPNDEYASELEWPAVERIELALQQHGLNPLSELRTLFQLIAAFRRLRPTLVVNYTVKPALYGSIAARLTRVPRVVSVFTGLGYWFTDARTLRSATGHAIRAALRLALRRNARVYFQNRDDRDLFVQLGLTSAAGTRIIDGSGVDTERFAPAAAGAAQATFLLVARLLAEKGVREFAAAAQELRRRHPQARFQLVGPIDRNPAAIGHAELDGWRASGAVEYLGEVPDVRPLIAAAGVVVLPSYREGTPRSVLEAMAMGKPIVTTDAPGCRETVQNGVNGFLVRPRDAHALAAAMETFLQQPGLIARMGSESRRIAVQRYSVAKVNAAFLDDLLTPAATSK